MSSSRRYTLSLSCPDRVGIVAAVTVFTVITGGVDAGQSQAGVSWVKVALGAGVDGLRAAAVARTQ